jgi:predicted nucleic acid-binding protein
VNVLDSSGWLEYFIDGPDAERFAPIVEDVDTLLVPALCIHEVTRRLLSLGLEAQAQTARSLMERSRVIELDAERAAAAAMLGLRRKLPMADAIIYAAAREFDATLWPQDEDFEGLPGVEYAPKGARRRRR